MPGLEPNSNSDSKQAPCRTCTDFKSWAKKQNVIFGSNADDQNAGRPDKVKMILNSSCRLTNQFKLKKSNFFLLI